MTMFFSVSTGPCDVVIFSLIHDFTVCLSSKLK